MNEQSIFSEALEKGDAAARAAFLDQACAGDHDLRQRVEKLLERHAQAGSFLESPSPQHRTTAEEPQVAEKPGKVIGPYKLLEQIGEGGFGVVFMAEQQEPIRRRVALKIIKPGMDTRQVIARFEAERQALALMDHPNIARVIDAGETTSGRPFFVMELVKGLPITEFCDQAKLPPRDRLELFASVCQAVQHAHQKGIIHRDIKPSNVLVTLHDGKPVAKVIDFGIAKATGVQLTERTLFTNFAAMIGTPLYMSPEQAGLSGLDVDTRSDIYSLGVLLYELLTGTTPLSRERLKAATYDEIRRIIREEDPPKPSTRLSTSETLPNIAANRGLEPKKLTGVVRGELDWIVMKALEKDRNRRYETANGFAMDVQRYLADEAVQACPPSAGYRFRKFARRNKKALVTAALLGATLLMVAGSFGWMALDRASRRGRTTEAVEALLDQCEDALRADRADRAAIALEAAERRAADGGAEELAGRLDRCRADLTLLRALDDIDTFRWTWASRSFPDNAAVAARWRAALAAYGVTPGSDPPTEAIARVNRSLVRDRVLTALDLWLASVPSAEEVAGVRAVLRSADPDPYRDAVRAAGDARAVAALAGRPEALTQPARFAAVLGRLRGVPADRALVVLESALRTRTGDLGLLMSLGETCTTNRPKEAGERVRWYQAALAAHPGNLAALNNLGAALGDQGNPDGAIAAYREAIRLDPTFVRAHANLGGILCNEKQDYDGAIAALQEALRLDPNHVNAHHSLGVARKAKGDTDGAIASWKEAIRIDPNHAMSHHYLGAILCDVRRDDDAAIPYLREAARLDPKNAEAHYYIGNVLRGKADVDGAIAAFREATRADPEYTLAHYNLGVLLCDVRRDYDGAIAAFREATRLDPKSAKARHNLGVALRGKGDSDGAIAAYREAIRIDPNAALAHYHLGTILYERRDFDGAIAAFREAVRLDPERANAQYNLGVTLCDVKRDYDGAIAAFREVIRLEPKNAYAHHNLGVALRGKGDRDGAIAAYREAIRLNPTHPNAHYHLGLELLATGNMDAAIAAFREATRIDPRQAFAHANLAWLLAAGPDGVRDGTKAVEHATRACELTAWKDAHALNTLAAAHAEAGDFDQAVQFQKKALDFPAFAKADGNGGPERLRLYAQKMAYRDPAFAAREVAPPPREGKP